MPQDSLGNCPVVQWFFRQVRARNFLCDSVFNMRTPAQRLKARLMNRPLLCLKA